MSIRLGRLTQVVRQLFSERVSGFRLGNKSFRYLVDTYLSQHVSIQQLLRTLQVRRPPPAKRSRPGPSHASHCSARRTVRADGPLLCQPALGAHGAVWTTAKRGGACGHPGAADAAARTGAQAPPVSPAVRLLAPQPPSWSCPSHCPIFVLATATARSTPSRTRRSSSASCATTPTCCSGRFPSSWTTWTTSRTAAPPSGTQRPTPPLTDSARLALTSP